MTILFKTSNLFETDCQAIVNTVNCVGVMGKGVALEFKKRWPDNYREYKRACDSGELRPGKILVYDRKSLLSSPFPRFLINFPTKDHWRSKSKISYIEQGLDSLVLEIKKHKISSIAIPPLGCGNGGLDWNDVRPIIVSKLSQLNDVEISIYGPAPPLIDDVPETFQINSKLTMARAMLLRAISAVEELRQEPVDRLSIHKLAYLLQEFGISLNISFDRDLYGPYSPRLRKAIFAFISWKMLKTSKEHENSRRISVTSAGFAAADDFIRQHQQDEHPLNRVLEFISGFENEHKLELLTSTLRGLRSPRPHTFSPPASPFPPLRSSIFSDEEKAQAFRRITTHGPR